MTRFSDWQRNKLYTAQDMVRRAQSHEARLVHGTTGDDRFRPIDSKGDAADELIRFATSVIFDGDPNPPVFQIDVSSQFNPYRAWAETWHNVIRVGKLVTPMTLVHEIAHFRYHNLYPPHGIEFMETYLSGITGVWGESAADELRSKCERVGVQTSYEERADYTYRRARWAAGPNPTNPVHLLTRPNTGHQVELRGVAQRTDTGLTIMNRWDGVTLDHVPYEHIAYIRRD